MKKRLKIALIAIICLVAAAGTGFFIYVSDYYRADETAVAAMTGENYRTVDQLTILEPAAPGDTALIFYPGGKVEHLAYLPLLELLRQQGITCVLVKMPFHLAVFDPNAASQVFRVLPDIKNWYIGGHSLGGAMAGSYAAAHPQQIKGLILLGAYRYGDYPAARSLIICGSQDRVLDKSRISGADNVIEIVGGNHAQFGNYGRQKGDGEASITRAEQQSQTVAAIVEFLELGSSG